MIKDTEIDTDPGRREPAEDRKRLLFGVLLLFIMGVLELTLGLQVEKQDLERVSGKSHWARLAVDTIDTAPGNTASDIKRILYISNSHAATGGEVTKHLQALLDELGLFGPPAILFYQASGAELSNARVLGEMDRDQFLEHVANVGQKL